VRAPRQRRQDSTSSGRSSPPESAVSQPESSHLSRELGLFWLGQRAPAPFFRSRGTRRLYSRGLRR
jgi:hypothetical protein